MVIEGMNLWVPSPSVNLNMDNIRHKELVVVLFLCLDYILNASTIPTVLICRSGQQTRVIAILGLQKMKKSAVLQTCQDKLEDPLQG